ncbi:shikimate dehydrogenase [Planosporangium flavigriseum]|uniref:Shikimate dehydrogenase (NADP(+)) n=1 Tax=Planosporangium flavigriseum TaxID=373681 RepID=A0A8J3PL04_9ACTN|nr:shikimate dehydrogenase [Planosporangium flavigriseum]NJC63705.1 shikimate dehydrogenase [Planosporangium flavigriseum]GIG72408.1 shikimate dehydrogenase (NADP(+)) [Planosporangium flavigriseum]
MSGQRSYLIGLVGAGIGPSLSPAMHERAADELGIRYLYRRLDLDELGLPATAIGEILAAARLAGYDGLNITHPCKQVVIEHLDELSADAAAMGAVNTVVFTEGRAVGHNTDWSGFARSIARGLPDATLDRVVLLGAGGAGAAVAHALLTLGAGVVRILDLDAQRAAALAAALCARFGAGRAVADRLDDGGAELATALAEADGLVHATPTGMAAHPGLPVPVELLRPELWVADVVYRPLNTQLVTTARARGCSVLDGGGMAVFQAVDAFRLFTGVEPDAGRMLRHFATLVADVATEADPTTEGRTADVRG